MIALTLIVVLRANLLAALVVCIILAVRTPVRNHFGAHLAYAMWAAVPLAIGGALMPVDYAEGPVGAAETLAKSLRDWLSLNGRDAVMLALWLAGVLFSLLLAGLSQARFLIAEKSGLVGPAVVGFVSPRLVSPSNFADRFTSHEWRLIRAHERAHIDRLDGRSLTMAVLMQCLFWFNPLAHIAVRAFRFDQELSCDATVMQRMPMERRRYAETLLCSESAGAHPLFGSSWRRGEPLETRIAALSLAKPSLSTVELGFDLLGLFLMVAFIAGWASQPPARSEQNTVELYGGLHIARTDLPPNLEVSLIP